MDDAVEQLGQLLKQAGARVTLDMGRSVSNPCTFCGQKRPPHKLMHIGTYPNGDTLTRPVCVLCEPVVAARSKAPVVASAPELTQLSARERTVVERLCRGTRLAAIAKELGISPHTVRNHMKHVFRKLGIHSQVELVSKLASGGGHG